MKTICDETTAAMPALTDRQRMCLELIAASLRDRGVPPTTRELCDATGIGSTNGVVGHLKALAAKGMIDLLPNTSRGLRLTAMGRAALGEPPDRAAALEGLLRECLAAVADEGLKGRIGAALGAVGG